MTSGKLCGIKNNMPRQSSFEEKRRYYRVHLHIPIHYHFRRVNEDFGIVRTKDISIGGLSFLYDEFVAPNTNITLDIFILAQSMRVSAVVAWSGSLPHSYRCRLGVKFTKIDSRQRCVIADYINMHSP